MTNADRLLLSIAHCPNLTLCCEHPSIIHPCARIIKTQAGAPVFHLPEPWNGDLARAPLLFISSNPSIDPAELYSTAVWPDGEILDFFRHRFGGGQRLWVKDGLRVMQTDGSYRKGWTRFWAAARRRAGEILGREAMPGEDYALCELVRCKSRNEEGVQEALLECAARYLDRTLALAGAEIIIGLGALARETLTARFGPVGCGNLHGPLSIAGRRRLLIFLPHPNARGKRKLADWLTGEDMTKIRKSVGDGARSRT